MLGCWSPSPGSRVPYPEDPTPKLDGPPPSPPWLVSTNFEVSYVCPTPSFQTPRKG